MGFWGNLFGGGRSPEAGPQPQPEAAMAEKAEQKPRTTEDLRTLGERRMEKVGEFFTKIGEKIKGAFARIGPLAKEVGIAGFAAPEYFAEGARETGRTIVQEMAKPAVEASVKFFKEDWNQTKKHADAAKAFVGKDWAKTREHGQAAVGMVKGVGLKTADFIQGTQERGKEIIAGKIGRLQEYGNHAQFVANEIKLNAWESINGIVEGSAKIVGGIIERARGGIVAKIEELKGRLEAYRRMTEIAREAKTKERLDNLATLAAKARAQRQTEVADLNRIIIARA